MKVLKVFFFFYLTKGQFWKQNQMLKGYRSVRGKSFTQEYLQNIMTYIISAGATQEVNHVICSVGGKLFHH